MYLLVWHLGVNVGRGQQNGAPQLNATVTGQTFTVPDSRTLGFKGITSVLTSSLVYVKPGYNGGSYSGCSFPRAGLVNFYKKPGLSGVIQFANLKYQLSQFKWPPNYNNVKQVRCAITSARLLYIPVVSKKLIGVIPIPATTKYQWNTQPQVV